MKTTVAALAVAATTVVSNAAEAETIKVSAIDWCPYICTEEEGRPGMFVEMLEEVFKGSQYDLDVKIYPWSRAIKNVEKGDDMILLSPTKNEAPSLHFPPTSIGAQQFCMFKRADDSWKFTDIDSAVGKKVIYAQDALPKVFQDASDKLDLEARPYAASYIPSATKMVERGRADGFLFTLNSTMYFINQSDFKGKIVPSGCVTPEALYPAMTPVAALADKVKEVEAFYEKRMVDLKNEGFYDSLLVKYNLK